MIGLQMELCGMAGYTLSIVSLTLTVTSSHSTGPQGGRSFQARTVLVAYGYSHK